MAENDAALDIGGQGEEKVAALLASVSEVMRTLVSGLAKRVDGSSPVNSLARHEYRRKLVLKQLRSGYFDLHSGDFEASSGASAGVRGGLGASDEMEEDSDDEEGGGSKDANKGMDDDSKDADEFRVAFEVYGQTRESLRSLITRIPHAPAEMPDQDRASDEDLARLAALRAEATEKNQRIKRLIDRLRQLRLELSALESR